MRNRSCALIGVGVMAALLILPALLSAGVWDTMNYQGVLTDASGTKVSGSTSITFSIWDAATSGDSLWGELHTITVADGVINVALGTTTPLSGLKGDKQYWLQLQVSGDVPMQRIKFSSVPYAANSHYLQGYAPGNALDIPINNSTLNTNLNADKLDGFDAGNQSAKIPISNTVLNTDLNADKLDGFDASSFAQANHTHAFAGVGGDGESTWVDVDTTHTTLASRSITAPAAGYALVIGTAEFTLTDTGSVADTTTLVVGVTKTDGTLPNDGDPCWAVSPEAYGHEIITVQRLFTVTQGSNTFYFQAFRGEVNAAAAAANRYLSVIFIPTSCGTVE